MAYSEQTKGVLERLPGNMSDEDVVKAVTGGIDSGTMGVSGASSRDSCTSAATNGTYGLSSGVCP